MGELEEILIPSSFSVNTIMFLSRLALPVTGYIAIQYGNLNYDDDKTILPRWIFILTAFSILWYSLFDAMASQRARRLQCETPIRKFINECT